MRIIITLALLGIAYNAIGAELPFNSAATLPDMLSTLTAVLCFCTAMNVISKDE